MIDSDKNIYIQETEIKPNIYVSLVLAVTMLSIAVSWVLNEFGIFRVGKLEMRIGCGVPLVVVTGVLIYLAMNRKQLANPKTKYFILASGILVTTSVTTLLTFHSTILLLFPMFIAMLYRSNRIGKVALAGSLFCTAFAPILGYVIGAWDIDFFRELILIGTNGTAVIEGAYPGITMVSIAKILLYIVLPRVLMVGSCAVLMFYVIKLGATHVQNQLKLNSISHRDALTGLYNQNFFKDVLADVKGDSPIGVIFFDVNDLKKLNDSRGHEYGDLLLKRCAKSIRDVCREDGECAFRLGGDEFILLIENATREQIERKIEEWQQAMEKVNEENESSGEGIRCSMAYGHALGKMNELQRLIHDADTMMYKNKAAEKEQNR